MHPAGSCMHGAVHTSFIPCVRCWCTQTHTCVHIPCSGGIQHQDMSRCSYTSHTHTPIHTSLGTRACTPSLKHTITLVQCSQTHHLHRAHICGSGAHGRPCRAHEAPARPKPPIWGLRPVPAEPVSARIAPKPTWGGCVCPKCARGMCECAQACAHPTAGLSSHPSNAFSVQ